jgi:hypothetical protein
LRIGGWTKSYIVEHHDLYLSSNNMVLKSRRIRWMGFGQCVGEEKCIQGFGGETWKAQVWKVGSY